jgi:hypothetical protein
VTIERRLLVSMSDIQAITFECKTCHRRESYPPDSVPDVPFQCLCGAKWRTDDRDVHPSTGHGASAFQKLVKAIMTVRTLEQENSSALRVLLEYEEPKTL